MKESKSYSRKEFFRTVTALGTIAAVGTSTELFAKPRPSKTGEIKLSILHTNDVHSRIDPFPMDGTSLQGLGGAARRMALIKEIRRQEDNVLLLDAGDMFQGTPYFNLFGGKLELDIMSKMSYDAGTFGNHEFDNGIDGLLKYFDHAKFPFLTANYDLSDTALKGKTKDYIVLERQGVKIGVFGLCIDPEGLVDPTNHRGLKYLDPIATANRIVPILRRQMGCDLVLCLSHLGYRYEGNQVSDLVLARETSGIDLIIGGHTHTFLDKPTEVKNKSGAITLVNQTGRSGVNLGRVDFYIDPKTRQKRYAANTYKINHTLDRLNAEEYTHLLG